MPADWWAIIFNPSFPYRLVHTVFARLHNDARSSSARSAPGICCARPANEAGARAMFSMAMGMISVVVPLQIFAGDQHGLNTLEYQPVKVMAMEGHFKSLIPTVRRWCCSPGPTRPGKNLFAIEIPKASSLILKHSWTRR